MLLDTYNTSKCLNGCTLFNDESYYLYWENRNVTTDELEIVKYLNENSIGNDLKIFHIGVGNSFLASNIKNYKQIDGITISKNELDYANKLNIKNYNVYFLNKFTHNAFFKRKFSTYDLIIDVNLKSFSCCEKAFNNLFDSYVSLLEKNGKIITGKKGMKWSRIVRPVISFSFKKFFHRRLKEFDGPERNILKIKNCLHLCKKHNLKFCHNEESNVIYFKKELND